METVLYRIYSYISSRIPIESLCMIMKNARFNFSSCNPPPLVLFPNCINSPIFMSALVRKIHIHVQQVCRPLLYTYRIDKWTKKRSGTSTIRPMKKGRWTSDFGQDLCYRVSKSTTLVQRFVFVPLSRYVSESFYVHTSSL